MSILDWFTLVMALIGCACTLRALGLVLNIRKED